MPDPVTIDDLNVLMEFGTLHGKIENYVCQTSNSGSQQIKIYSDDTYKNNAVNTALRIRVREIFAHAMSTWNPQIHDDFRERLESFYMTTIYLFFVGTIQLKARYFQITQSYTYKFLYRSSSDLIYEGPLSPDQYLEFTENDILQDHIDCYRDNQLFNSIEIKTVSIDFDIRQYYKDLFSS